MHEADRHLSHMSIPLNLPMFQIATYEGLKPILCQMCVTKQLWVFEANPDVKPTRTINIRNTFLSKAYPWDEWVHSYAIIPFIPCAKALV